MSRILKSAVLIAMAGILCLPMAEAQKKKSTIRGAGLGALAGQLLGGDTEATLVGAAVGGGVGYVVGNEKDKKQAEEMDRQQAEQAAAEAAAADPGPPPEEGAPADPVDDDLDESRWRVRDITPKDLVPPYDSKFVTFRSNGTVETITTLENGEDSYSKESFRIVDNVLVINKPGYLVNIEFELKGDELILSNEDFVILLTRIKSE